MAPLPPNTAPTLFSIIDFAILLIFCCALNQNKEHFFEIILKSDHWPRRRCCLKVFSIFSSSVSFVQLSVTILAYLVEGHPKNTSIKLFENWSIDQREDII